MVLVPVNQLDQPVVQPPDKQYLTELDKQIEAILNNKSMATDMKAKMYNHAVQQFTGFKNSDQQVTDLIEKKVEQKVKPDVLNVVVETVPRCSKNKAKLLIEHLKTNKDISWNEKQELIYKGKVVASSNIQDLISTFVRPFAIKSNYDISGWREFAKGLLDNNVPQMSIMNKELLKKAIRPSTNEEVGHEADDDVFQEAQVSPDPKPPLKRPRANTPQTKVFTRSDFKKSSPGTQTSWRNYPSK